MINNDKPNFIEIGDAADTAQPLPIFVTRKRTISKTLTLKKMISLLSTPQTKR